MLQGIAAGHFVDFRNGVANDVALSFLLDLDLIEAGISAPADPVGATPMTSLLDHRILNSSPWLLFQSIREQRKMRIALESLSLGALLAPTGLPRADPETCRPVAEAFARSSRYRDATDQCLVRALAMRAMLAHRGLGVDLIIGVMFPFAAHCWLQAGSVVLSDPFDRVRNFKPLLTAQ